MTDFATMAGAVEKTRGLSQSGDSYTGDYHATAEDNITATGSTRADAYQLTCVFNNITGADTTNANGVILEPIAGQVGQDVVIINNTANSFVVFAAGNDTIDGVAGATGTVMPTGRRSRFMALAAGKWISARLGAAN